MDGWARNGLDEHCHSVDPSKRGFGGNVCCCAMDAGKNMMNMILPSLARACARPCLHGYLFLFRWQVASTICLAIASRAVQPLLPGIELLQVCCRCIDAFCTCKACENMHVRWQGYIEWNIATGFSAALAYAANLSSVQVIIATGTLVGVFGTLLDSSRMQMTFYKLSSMTFQSISTIMFTNSIISWVLSAFSTKSSAPTVYSTGSAVASLTGGIVAARIMVLILSRRGVLERAAASAQPSASR